jgi:hypothetical protein
MKKPTVRLHVEGLESRLAPSATPLAAPALSFALVGSPAGQHADALAGTLHGQYTGGATGVDAGSHYTLFGAGSLGRLGWVHAAGDLQALGLVVSGHAGGTLTLSNGRGKVTLELEGPAQPGFAPLPEQFRFTVQQATGAYKGLRATGTITLQLRPALAPNTLPGGGGSFTFTGGRGTFTLIIRPDDDPPPWSDQTGIEGVAMVGPIFPVARPGFPDSRPLPGALITVQPAGGGREIAEARADAHGRFLLRLAPGTYLLVPLPPKPGQFLPRGVPQTVTVPADGFAQVVVNYDSGIR